MNAYLWSTGLFFTGKSIFPLCESSVRREVTNANYELLLRAHYTRENIYQVNENKDNHI